MSLLASDAGPATAPPMLDGSPPCLDAGPAVFFAEDPATVERAKAMCHRCQVRVACLAGARDRREPWGVWGGELFQGGRVVPRKRPRGRPRKTPDARRR